MEVNNEHNHQVSDIGSLTSKQRLSLVYVVGLNLALVALLVVAGFRYHSLVLISAATHQLVDAAGAGITLVALMIALRPASTRHSYGFARLEVLAALVNGIILLATTGWIVWAAIDRLVHPVGSDGSAVSVVGLVGTAVSLIAILVLHRSRGDSLAIRSNIVHFAADSAAWIVTVIAGLLTAMTGIERIDPIASIAVSALVVVAAWHLIVKTADVLLEATPKALDPIAVRDAILRNTEISAVHHLHIWSLSSQSPALSAHLVFSGPTDLHSAQASVEGIKSLLHKDYGIEHATLEIECHPCEAPEHALLP